MRILLVEPMYKNKYPPMGLMKISTYHKQRGDTVHFFKGTMSLSDFKENEYERVYITSLFTFYYDKVIKTIEYYEKLIARENIYVGGIMVTILKEKIQRDTEGIHLLTGLLTDSGCLGYGDHVNVDELPLDYSILDEIEYQYPAEGNYFSYTTRGCPNHCKFCAVPILEPEYKETNRIVCQIEEVNRNFGEKRNLLLMDNNIFNLEEDKLERLVHDIQQIGFTKEPTYIAMTPIEKFYAAASNPRMHPRIMMEAIRWLEHRTSNIRNEKEKSKFSNISENKMVQNMVAAI